MIILIHRVYSKRYTLFYFEAGCAEMIRAVLFDMDGVLVDSERIAMETNIQVGKELGYPVSKELCFQLLGANSKNAHRIFAENIPNFDQNLFFARVHSLLYNKIENGEVKVKPGLIELLDYLNKEHGV